MTVRSRSRSALAHGIAVRFGLVVGAILAVLVAACASGGQSVAHVPVASTADAISASPYPLDATGTDGVTLRIAQRPDRLISLSAGYTETLFAIGAGELVVATDRFSNYPDAAKGLPKVEFTQPSAETLVALRPDLVIASGRQRDSVIALRSAGLRVLLLEEPATVHGVSERATLFGRITDRLAAAETLAAQMDARVQAVAQKLADVGQGPSVFHELSPQLSTAAPASFVGDLYTILKARNIADGGVGTFPQLTQEAIIARNPQVIVLTDGPVGVTLEQARSRSGWSTINAVRSGRVYLLTPAQVDTVSRPGPRVVEGLELLARLLYPERF